MIDGGWEAPHWYLLCLPQVCCLEQHITELDTAWEVLQAASSHPGGGPPAPTAGESQEAGTVQQNWKQQEGFEAVGPTSPQSSGKDSAFEGILHQEGCEVESALKPALGGNEPTAVEPPAMGDASAGRCEADAEIAALAAERTGLLHDLNTAEAKIGALSAERDSLACQLHTAGAAATAATAERSQLLADLVEAKGSLQQAQIRETTAVQEREEACHQLLIQVSSLQADLDAVGDESAAAVAEKNQVQGALGARIEALLAERDAAVSKADDMRRQLAVAEEAALSIAELRTQVASLEGRVGQIHGPGIWSLSVQPSSSSFCEWGTPPQPRQLWRHVLP